MKLLNRFIYAIFLSQIIVSLYGCSDDDETGSEEPIEEEDVIVELKTAPDVTGRIDGHDYVDMGDGLKWATVNIGATAPEDYGSYFAWAETKTKGYYSYDNYAFFKEANKPPFILTSVNAGEISGSKYDAAKVNWGGSWRMPTKSEFENLCYYTKTKKCTYKGVKGVLFIASNGNGLFLPAAGYKIDYDLEDEGLIVKYWTSTMSFETKYTGCYYDAWTYFFYLEHEHDFMSTGYRLCGLPIRAVHGKSNSNDNPGGGGSGTSGDVPYVINFNFTATQSSITVKFMATEKPTSATIYYGETTANKSLSTTITNKQVSAKATGLKKGTKYYFKCKLSNSYGSSTSDLFAASTNY